MTSHFGSRRSLGAFKINKLNVLPKMELTPSTLQLQLFHLQKLRSQKHVGCWRLPTHMLLAFQLCLLRCSRGPGSCSSRSKQVECLTQWKLTPLLRVEELNARFACGVCGRNEGISHSMLQLFHFHTLLLSILSL